MNPTPQGRYHLAGVRAGNHVLQIDTDSLADGLEPVACTDNTRIAGNALSQFIDVQGGTLWRANFHVRPKQAATAPASARPASRSRSTPTA